MNETRQEKRICQGRRTYNEAIVAEMEMVAGIEAGLAVDTFVGDEIGQAAEDVAAHLALVDQIAFVRQQFADL